MAALNKQMIIGNLVKDPEMRETTGGKRLAVFSVAVNEKYGDKEETEYFDVALWDKLADVAERYLKKGDSVYIEGKRKTHTWDDQGVRKYRTELIGFVLQMLGSKPQINSADSSGNVASFG